jgi:predicted protein tyrosine phosphatase
MVIQKVTFMSRSKAAAMWASGREALISIHDVNEQPLDVESGWLGVLHIRCHHTDEGAAGQEAYSLDKAQKVLDFVRKHGDYCEHLVVHCHAGERRSAGVALMLAELLSVPCYKESVRVDASGYQTYNKLLYSTTLKAALNEPDDVFMRWCGML